MHTDIGTLAPNQAVDDVYLLRVCQLRATKTGKFYLHAELGDRTGQVTARFWNATEALFQALEGVEFVRVTGRVEVYQDSLQLNVNTLRGVRTEEVAIEDFLPATEKDVEEMFRKLRELAGTVREEPLSKLLACFLDDGDFVTRFKRAPAAVSYHQPYLGGLLEHTLSVAEMADYVASRYPRLNRDLLITGTILHDVGKVEELCYTRAFDYTDRGLLVGHLILGVQMVQDHVRRIDAFPRQLFDLLSHLILSHHGEYEWGSPKLPMTAEAFALHHLDNLDAKVEASLRAIETDRLAEGNWTEYSKMFQRKLYRGPRSAPGEEAD